MAQEDFSNVQSLKSKINTDIKTGIGVAMFYVTMTEKFGGDVDKLRTFYEMANSDKISYQKDLNRPAGEENTRTCNKKYLKVNTILFALLILFINTTLLI